MPYSSDKSFSQGDDKLETIESLIQDQTQSSRVSKGLEISSKNAKKKKKSSLGATRIFPSERTETSTLDLVAQLENTSDLSLLANEHDETDLQSQNATIRKDTDDADHAAWDNMLTHESRLTKAVTNQLGPRTQKSGLEGHDVTATPSRGIPISPGSSKPFTRSPGSPSAFSSYSPPPLASFPTKYRRSSMALQYAARQSPFAVPSSALQSRPPLPHHPQAHFYNPPQINIPGSSSSMPAPAAGDGGYYCRFDSLASTGDCGTSPAQDVVLIGWEGGLDVYSVSKESMDFIGRLSGLWGSVVDAKIIPTSQGFGSGAAIGPLICVVVNGPSIPKVDNSTRDRNHHDEGASNMLSESPPEKAASLLDNDDELDAIDHYETSVEIYSISTNQHVSTLLTTAPTPIAVSPSSPLFDRPRPSGHLSIQASSQYVVISSGESGEVFLFQSELAIIDENPKWTFPCIGKIWTNVSSQPRQNHSRSPSASRSHTISSVDLFQDQYPIGKPLVSLKHRWLAFSPASPSRPFIGAITHTDKLDSRIPGLSTHRAPPLPQINCALEIPEGDGVMKWIAREVTQEVIKSAKWVGGKAIQTFNSFWNPELPQDTQSNYTQGIPQGDGTYSNGQQFPPTHAPTLQRSQNDGEPSLVSIIDLDKLAKSHLPPSAPPLPFATFPALQGCTFLSFATDGLRLLVTSAKGDNHAVWDLMRLINGRWKETSSSGAQSITKARVRQVAMFHRLTPSTTIDVVWSESIASRFAVVTDKGTVHVHDLPEHALQWPPRRRAIGSKSGPSEESKIIEPSEPAISAAGAAATAVNAVSAAFKLVNNTTQPIITAAQRRGKEGKFGPQQPAVYSASTFTRKPSGHAVAQGLSKSLGAATGTVNNIRNANENLLRIPASENSMRPGCAHWLGSAQSPQIAVVGGGYLRIHAVGSRLLDESGLKKRVAVAKSTTHFALPKLPDLKLAPVFSARLGLETIESPQAFWSSPIAKTAVSSEEPHLLSQAELDTNPPYQPFHADRRVNLYTYNSVPQDAGRSVYLPNEVLPNDGQVHDDMTAWAFGEELPATRLDISLHQDRGGPREDAMITSTKNLYPANADDEVLEQIVLTTRRTRRGRRKESDHPEANEDGFFEEDCEILDFVSDVP